MTNDESLLIYVFEYNNISFRDLLMLDKFTFNIDINDDQ